MTNNSVQHYSFIYTQFNGSKYWYVMLIIQLRYAVKEFQVLLFMTNNSVQHYSFIYTQFNGSKYWYVMLIIQLRYAVKEFQVLLTLIVLRGEFDKFPDIFLYRHLKLL